MSFQTTEVVLDGLVSNLAETGFFNGIFSKLVFFRLDNLGDGFTDGVGLLLVELLVLCDGYFGFLHHFINFLSYGHVLFLLVFWYVTSLQMQVQINANKQRTLPYSANITHLISKPRAKCQGNKIERITL